MKITALSVAGDTIVEVLIAILVVSAVLAGAYASAGNSLNGTRQAQERGEALKLAEGQLEQIKANVAAAKVPTNLFCIDNTSGNAIVANSPTQRSITTVTPLASDSLSDYVAGCKSGNTPYNISVTRSGDDTNGYIFTAYVRWFTAGGSNRGEVKLIYRAYP